MRMATSLEVNYLQLMITDGDEWSAEYGDIEVPCGEVLVIDARLRGVSPEQTFGTASYLRCLIQSPNGMRESWLWTEEAREINARPGWTAQTYGGYAWKLMQPRSSLPSNYAVGNSFIAMLGRIKAGVPTNA